MRVLCFEFKIVTVQYFLDDMQEYEVSDYIDNLKFLNRDSWEQCRFQVYANAQMNTKKSLKPTDIIKLPWDNESGEADEKEISTEEIMRLKEMSRQIIENSLNTNGKQQNSSKI